MNYFAHGDEVSEEVLNSSGDWTIGLGVLAIMLVLFGFALYLHNRS